MLDLAGILFSSVIMLMGIIRAVQLDRTQPWFQKVKRKDPGTSAANTPWKRPS